MPSLTEFGFSRHHRRETVDVFTQLPETNQLFPDLGFPGDKIESLTVDKLITGTISSQQITLGITQNADGDVYIAGGTFSATAWTATGGFILGLDDSDTNDPKFYIGDASSSMDWNVTTADTLTVVGSITATSGFIGGWTITTGYLYDLTSGTPTAVPNNGIVMDSGNAAIIAYEGTAERVRMGYLSAGVYGFRAYATNGTTVLFEASDTRQVLAGWNFEDGYLYNLQSGTPTAAPNDGIVLASGNEAMIIYEDTEKRLEVGYLSAGIYGMRVYATDGTTVIWESSDTRQVAGGWNFTDTVFRSGATDAASNVLIDSANSLLRLGPTTGNYLSLDGANLRIRSSNYVSGNFGAGFTLEPNLLEVGNISSRGIFRTAVFQKATIAAVGGSLAILPADKLNATMSALDAATLTVSGNETFAVNDRLRIKSDGQDEWFIVTNAASAPTYTVTRDAGGAYGADANPAWTTGASVVNYGASGTGGVYITSTDTNSPYLDVFTHAGSPWSTITTRARLGNLAGITDAVFGALSGFGLWTDNIYLTGAIMATSGRIGSSTNYWNIGAGSLAAVGAGNVEIRAGQTAFDTGTGFWLGLDSGTAKFSFGNSASSKVTWDGTTLLISGALTMDASTGTVSINQSATTGSSLSVIRNLAAASTDSAVVYFQNDNAGDDQYVLHIVQDCNANATWIRGIGNTTAAVLQVEGDALTTGQVGYFYSNSASASARNLVNIVNDNTLATGAIGLRIQQDAASGGMIIAQNGNGEACAIDTLGTTASSLRVTGDALTTGRLGYFYSNSADTNARNLVEIVNDNALATSAICLRLQQDANNVGLSIVTAATTQAAIEVTASSLTTGSAGYFYSNSTDTSVRFVINAINDNALATGAVCLGLQQDGGNAHIRMTGDPANSSPTDGDLWFSGSRLGFRNGTITGEVGVMVTGTYVGNNTDNRALSLGVNPRFIQVHRNDGSNAGMCNVVSNGSTQSGTILITGSENQINSGASMVDGLCDSGATLDPAGTFLRLGVGEMGMNVNLVNYIWVAYF